MSSGRAAGGLARTARSLAAISLVVLLPGAAAGSREAPLEIAVKATYLVKFIPFVDWPASAFATPASPIVLCVVGDDPFGDLLDRAAAGQNADGRPFQVRRYRGVERDTVCHVLYIAGPESSAAAIFEILRGRPVLTVTDAAPQGDGRGIVNFVLVESRVRFEIDEGEAASDGLILSSKLLHLAVSVTPRS